VERGVAATVVRTVQVGFMTAIALAFMAVAVVFFIGAWLLRLDVHFKKEKSDERDG
jgi:hypothetical protein